MSNPDVFRPWSGYFMAGVIFFISAGLTIQSAISGGAHDLLTTVAWGTAASCGAYLIFIRPKVTIFDEGITITNPLIEITAGWQRVEEIEARYSMSILVGNKTIYAWAAPAPGRHHARSVHKSEMRGLNLGANTLMRPGESPRSHSGAASQIARLRLEEFRKLGTIKGLESQVRYNSAGATVMVTSLVLGLLLSVIHF
ncbi:MAG: hypothetical protein F2845_07205 [Actinobacteria bacterium]|nr:hypothetical protein [Actinomycetota bacterium]MSV64633.1 hypothetical protein [Actinomycetota bacterium]MSW27038.1 hypothetical protein [Actinomycetota bacterium]MSW34745.1 hypothetical protein [Actinomycetota bacterium]MSX31371.1 hypothetical protein [Actinomycetota bacterium]